MVLYVRKATPDNTEELRQILEEARVFKNSLGDKVWGDEPFTSEEARGTIERGNTYIAWVDGRPAGSVVLVWEDTRTWGKMGADNQAGYIHRLCTARVFRGQNVGKQIIDWAAGQIRQAERTCIRLDCSYENRPLCKYYEHQGFTEISRTTLDNGTYSAVLYQREI